MKTKSKENAMAGFEKKALDVLREKGSFSGDALCSIIGMEPDAGRKLLSSMERNGMIAIKQRRAFLINGTDVSSERGRIAVDAAGRMRFEYQGGAKVAWLGFASQRRILPDDEVVCAVFKPLEAGGESEAIPTKFVSRARDKRVLVCAETGPNGINLVLDRRADPQPVTLSEDEMKIVSPGDFLVCTLDEHGFLRSNKPAKAALSSVLTNKKTRGFEGEVVLFYSPQDKRYDGLDESPVVVDKSPVRQDLRGVPFLTVDGENSKDFDDAVFAEETAAGWNLFVAIADVSAFVDQDDALDADAQKRMATIYLPNKTITMLPAGVANGTCSLKPNEERLAVCCKMAVSRSGEVLSHEFSRITMVSHNRLTYSQVHDALSGSGALPSDVLTRLSSLEACALALKAKAGTDGRLSIKRSNAKHVMDADGKIADIVEEPAQRSQVLVEECMLAANHSAAEFLAEKAGAGFFRNHYALDVETMEGVASLARTYGFAAAADSLDNDPKRLGDLLVDSQGTEFQDVLSSYLLGNMSSARYERDNSGHFSLALTSYSHFTSPIRRYPDLITHRMIKCVLDGDTERLAMLVDRLPAFAASANVLLKTSSSMESEARKMLLCEYAGRRLPVGEQLSLSVVSANERGCWVSVFPGVEIPVNGMAMKKLGASFDETEHVWKADGDRVETISVAFAGSEISGRKPKFDAVGIPTAKPSPEKKPGL